MLRELDARGVVGGAPVALSVLVLKLLHALLDVGGARGEPLGQPRVDARDLHHRALPGGDLAELGGDVESLADLRDDGLVVELGCRDVHAVEELGVEGPPLPVGPLDLVGDDEVVVKLGVAVTGVVVAEACGDDAALDLDLRNPVAAGAGRYRLALEVLDRLGDGLFVRGLDGLPGGLVAECPERRDALRGGEHQVEPGDGLLRSAARGRDEATQLFLVLRLPALRLAERLCALAGTDESPLRDGGLAVVDALEGGVSLVDASREGAAGGPVGVVATAEAGGILCCLCGEAAVLRVLDDPVGVGVQPLAEQCTHLVLGHRARDAEEAQP